MNVEVLINKEGKEDGMYETCTIAGESLTVEPQYFPLECLPLVIGRALARYGPCAVFKVFAEAPGCAAHCFRTAEQVQEAKFRSHCG